MGDDFTIRLAGVADAPTLARHRAEMFRDMGELPDELYDPLVEAAQRALDECLRTGEYVAWVVCPADHPDQIVAGAGTNCGGCSRDPSPIVASCGAAPRRSCSTYSPSAPGVGAASRAGSWSA